MRENIITNIYKICRDILLKAFFRKRNVSVVHVGWTYATSWFKWDNIYIYICIYISVCVCFQLNGSAIIRLWPVDSPHKWPVMKKASQNYDEIISTYFSVGNAVDLYHDLFGNYTPVRPVTVWTKTVDIELMFSLYQIKALVSYTIMDSLWYIGGDH